METSCGDFSTMMPRPIRIVVLVCSLLFALPPGWCCLLGAHTPGQLGKSTSRRCPECCGGHAAETSKSAPVPTSPRPTKCPCDDRNSTSPDSTGKLHGIVALPALGDVVSLLLLPVIGSSESIPSIAVCGDSL